MSTNLLEKAILTKVEELIRILIELSDLKEEKKKSEFRKQGINKCQEITPLLLHFLEGKEEYVEPMIYQLVQEKLPASIVLNSFGQLQEELNFVVQEGIKVLKAEVADKQSLVEEENNENNLEVERLDSGANSSLFQGIRKILPNYELIANHKVRGQVIDVYISELKIGITGELKPSSFAKLSYVCQQDNIKLVNVPKTLLENPRKLVQYIKAQKLG